MKYFDKVEGTVKRDELFAGVEVAVLTENVSLASGAEFQRGCILAGASGVFQPVTSSADASKVLVISAEDVESDSKVATAYVSGIFNTAKLSTGASVVSAADFKEPLRQVNILLADTKQI